MPVDILPAALAEVRQARLRLGAARPGYGRRLQEAINTASRRIDETPRQYPPVDDSPDGLEVRYVHLKRYSYQVIFVVLGELKLIVAVSHDSQEPNYWFDRLPPAT
jgi:plasmid stabilization system protein ParE